MKIDAKKLLTELKSERGGNRGSVTMYMDKDLFARFKAACGDVPPSKVVEEFIRQFLASKPKK